MKKFLVKTSFFVLPFALLFLFSVVFYALHKGDLLRLGYIFNRSLNYRKIFQSEFDKPIKYTELSQFSKKKKYKLLTIGDSFSDQNSSGYQNYFPNDIDVLSFDRSLEQADNPLQTAIALANGDFFDSCKVDYVVLENVERYIVDRAKHTDTKNELNWAEIEHSINEKKENNSSNGGIKHEFFSSQAMWFLYYAIQDFLHTDYYFNENVYKTVLTRNDLFSVNTNSLLFYKDDLGSLVMNDSVKNVKQLNEILNSLDSVLKQKNVRLVVLIAPDKYDLYYEFITDKSKYKNPHFFGMFDEQSKNYLYINSKGALKNLMREKRDVYFYDDTHWSPWSAQLIASEIQKVIL